MVKMPGAPSLGRRFRVWGLGIGFGDRVWGFGFGV